MSQYSLEELENTLDEIGRLILELRQEINNLPEKHQKFDLANSIRFVSGTLDRFVSWIDLAKQFEPKQYSMSYQSVEAVVSGVGLAVNNLKLEVERLKQAAETKD